MWVDLDGRRGNRVLMAEMEGEFARTLSVLPHPDRVRIVMDELRLSPCLARALPSVSWVWVDRTTCGTPSLCVNWASSLLREYVVACKP